MVRRKQCFSLPNHHLDLTLWGQRVLPLGRTFKWRFPPEGLRLPVQQSVTITERCLRAVANSSTLSLTGNRKEQKGNFALQQ